MSAAFIGQRGTSYVPNDVLPPFWGQRSDTSRWDRVVIRGVDWPPVVHERGTICWWAVDDGRFTFHRQVGRHLFETTIPFSLCEFYVDDPSQRGPISYAVVCPTGRTRLLVETLAAFERDGASVWVAQAREHGSYVTYVFDGLARHGWWERVPQDAGDRCDAWPDYLVTYEDGG